MILQLNSNPDAKNNTNQHVGPIVQIQSQYNHTMHITAKHRMTHTYKDIKAPGRDINPISNIPV